MSRVLYFDCFSGISGDMVLGAALDAGLPLDDLRRALGSLVGTDVRIGSERVLRSGISATRFLVEEATEDRHHHHPHRTLREIDQLVDRSALSQNGRERAHELFRRLAEAEAAIHQVSLDHVHLHEVGALDSIVDIVGAVHALEWLGADRVISSPLNVGGGSVDTAHGRLPVPAPATVALLGRAPIYSTGEQVELVTPTGALIATSYADSFGSLPAMAIERTGYGAGARDTAGRPNVLRLLVGHEAAVTSGDRVSVIECEIDDMNPQIFGIAMDRLYAAGALEVFYVPVQMKKNRPGTLLTVIGPTMLKASLIEIVFRETTTIGLRHHEVDRECLQREIVTVNTSIGPVRFKVARRQGRVVNASPEFDDCVKLAAQSGLSVKDVQSLAVQAYGHLPSRPS